MKRLLLLIACLPLCLAASATFVGEEAMKADLLQMLARFTTYMKADFQPCVAPNSIGEACGCFRGENTMGADERGVRPNADLSMICAFLVKYGKGQVELPAGVTWADLEQMAMQSLVFAYSTHKANRLKVCAGNRYWGSVSVADHVWESSLWAMSVAYAAFFQWHRLTDDQRGYVYQLLKAECNYELERDIPTAFRGDTKAEENGWEADVLAATLGLFPDDVLAPQWFQRLRAFAVNSYSHPADSADTTVIDPAYDLTTVADLYTEPFNDVATDDRPVTVVPPTDAEFSNKNWPEGWQNIDPYLSYRNLFNGVASPKGNPELIFTRGNIETGDHDNGIASLVGHSMPTSLNGWNTHGLTQKMVDTYYMKDGTDVDGMYSEWRTPGETTVDNPGNDRERPAGFITRSEVQNNVYPEVLANPTNRSLSMSQRMNVSHQYAGREPRFYASVAYNGTIWEQLGNPTNADQMKQVTYYRAGADGYRNSFAYLRTGIGVKKYYHPHDYFAAQPSGGGSYGMVHVKFEPAIRYADILLLYAECLNELTQGQTYQQTDWKGQPVTIIGRNLDEMKRGIRPIRIRAGLPDYTAAEYADQDVLRAKLKRERMIEFMGEGKRYFDLRRWMDAPVEENKRVYGLNVFMTSANKEEFMQVIPVYNLSATFTDKMYFWPISFTDLKRNKNLVQNPGWKYND